MAPSVARGRGSPCLLDAWSSNLRTQSYPYLSIRMQPDQLIPNQLISLDLIG